MPLDFFAGGWGLSLIVGMEDRVDQFMRVFTYEDGKWYFSRGTAARLPVTEDEVNEAEQRFRLRFQIATAISWAAILGAVAWCYGVVLANDEPLWKFAYAFVPAVYVSVLAYSRAALSALGPLRWRLWDLELQRQAADTSGKRRRSALEPRSVVVHRTWLLWAMFLGWSALSAWEYRNNVRALNGVTVAATVTRSDARDGGKCRVDYAFAWRGKTYSGTEMACKVMDSHPVGSRLAAKIDPERPGHPVLPGSSPWPPEIVIPIFLAPILLLLLVVM
jgi:hypothetical protein